MRKPTPHDIVIETRLPGDGSLDVKMVLGVLDNLENALYSSDRDDVVRAASALQLPSVVRDAALERLRSFRHRRLHFLEARPGSLTLFAIVTGVSIFVLDRTLGESLKEGWTHSETHRTLREFFRRQIDAKAAYIAEATRRAFGSKGRDVVVRSLPPENGAPHRIVVDAPLVDPKPGSEPVPTIGEELDERRK